MRFGRVVLLVVGISMTLGSIVGLGWNEYRYRARIGDLEWARNRVVSIPADTVQSKWDGQLVHLEGELDAEGKRRDPLFHVEREAAYMVRRVEMYQWEEHEIDYDDTRDVYKYRRDWSEDRIDPERFMKPQKFQRKVRAHDSRKNPTFPVSEQTFLPSRVTLGAYRVSDDVLQTFGTGVVPLDSSTLSGMPEKYASRAELTKKLDWLIDKPNAVCIRYQGTSPPCGDEVGDVRVRWEIQGEGGASAIAGLDGDRLVPFDHPTLRKPMVLVDAQKIGADWIIDKAVGDAWDWVWIFRLVGLFMLPFPLFFALQALHDEEVALPRVGQLEQSQVFIGAGGLAVGLMLTIMGAGWVVSVMVL